MLNYRCVATLSIILEQLFDVNIPLICLNAYLFFRKISLPYSERRTRIIQEHSQLRNIKQWLMIFLKGILKCSFIWRANRWRIWLIFWRKHRMFQKDPQSWILKISKQLFQKWIPRWKIFQLQARYYAVLCTFEYIIYWRHVSPLACLISLSIGIFQVAAQQGVYLAKCFNRMEDCEKNPEGPLRFRGEGRHRFRPFRYELNWNLCVFFWSHALRLDET